MTKFKSFSYKKKKDSEVKNYLVMVLDDTESHIGGLDMSKLSEEEIELALKIKIELDTLENSEEEFEELEEYKALYEKFSPFIKKSYRKYIKENINEVVFTENIKDVEYVEKADSINDKE